MPQLFKNETALKNSGFLNSRGFCGCYYRKKLLKYPFDCEQSKLTIQFY